MTSRREIRVATSMVVPQLTFVRILILLATFCIPVVRSEIYTALLSDKAVVFNDGDTKSGLEATAAANGQKIDPTSVKVAAYVKYLMEMHDQILNEALGGQVYTKLYSYTFLLNGVALDITDEQAALLRQHEMVLNVQKDPKAKASTTHTPDYLGLPQGIWYQIGGVNNAGEGVVIGILDTGIDPTHPSFQNAPQNPYAPLDSTKFRGVCEVAEEFPSGSCNGKIVAARHFADAAIAAGTFNATYDFASPLDGDGHGTHTASTAAGNSGVTVYFNGANFGQQSGMAPRARLAIYKALFRGLGGGGYFADLVAGIEQGVIDGIDILSMSLGVSFPFFGAEYLNPLDVACLGAVHAGVLIVQADGNSGPYPSSSLSFSPWIFSVAAGSHDRIYPNYVTLGSHSTLSAAGIAVGTNGVYFEVILSTNAQIVGADSSEECQDATLMQKDLVSGRILMCMVGLYYYFGTSTFPAAVTTAKTLGAAGVIFVVTPNVEGVYGDLTPLGDALFPSSFIVNLDDATILTNYYNESTTLDANGTFTNTTATALLSGGITPEYTGAPPAAVTFSSRGPAYNSYSETGIQLADILKPNIMAPGNIIWAAWSPIGIDAPQFSGGRFAAISGTSMACPHIAGIAALLKQRYPTWSPAAIVSALSTTADILDKARKPLQAYNPSSNVSMLIGTATAFDIGSGQVNPTAALDPGLIFDAGIQDYANFLCKIPTVTRDEAENVTGLSCPRNLQGYASDLNAPSIVCANLAGTRDVPRTVTSVGVDVETYKITVSTGYGIRASVKPTSFAISPAQTLTFVVRLTAYPIPTKPTTSFGSVVLTGSLGHVVQVPIAIPYLLT